MLITPFSLRFYVLPVHVLLGSFSASLKRGRALEERAGFGFTRSLSLSQPRPPVIRVQEVGFQKGRRRLDNSLIIIKQRREIQGKPSG